LKALAEFILRGRLQALIVALIGSFFPLISSAAIALVSICKGAKEGTLLFLWVSLALVLIQQAGSENPLLTAVSIASLGIMVIAATVHKVLASWQWTLLAIVAVAVAISQALGIFMESSVTNLVATAQEMLSNVKSQEQDAAMSHWAYGFYVARVSSYHISCRLQ
jgi:glucan phosphoethanolaminetransferase (alkaline phosphatase superfamily)